LGIVRPGYEIHHGRVTVGGDAQDFLGGARAGSVFGTMWHGSLEGDERPGQARPPQADRRVRSQAWKSAMWCSLGTRTPPEE
jgi:formylmethanofuran dehydrogenase subunit C